MRTMVDVRDLDPSYLSCRLKVLGGTAVDVPAMIEVSKERGGEVVG